jgi:flavin-binding protein dodecin
MTDPHLPRDRDRGHVRREGLNQAITNGISRAGETLRHLDWFEVTEIRGHLADNQIDHYQVTL